MAQGDASPAKLVTEWSSTDGLENYKRELVLTSFEQHDEAEIAERIKAMIEEFTEALRDEEYLASGD